MRGPSCSSTRTSKANWSTAYRSVPACSHLALSLLMTDALHAPSRVVDGRRTVEHRGCRGVRISLAVSLIVLLVLSKTIKESLSGISDHSATLREEVVAERSLSNGVPLEP